MKQARDLYNTLKEMLGSSDIVFPAIVKTVDKNKSICDVEFDGLEMGGVRLQSIVDDNLKGCKFFPKIESVVLVQRLSDKGEMFVLMMSEVEEVNFSIGETLFKQDLNGFQIKKGDDSLQKCFDDLFNQIGLLTVNCTAPGTPSGIPINKAAFTIIQKRINNILK